MVVKGQKINDRYQIIRLIGEGGMANVYLAHDLILDRDVAVKILRGDLADDEKFVRRFQREAISASSLSHPNIVEVYDVGEENGDYYIVMEYINGKTLKTLVKRRGALTLSEVMDIMQQLTSAIACAHNSYIIHRDIKPQNVMILDDGTVKIADFGIAMALNGTELTQTNSVMGSVHYLPPEQANGKGATMKSDIYSLGILMYELLVGKLPFKGETAVEIAMKQLKDQIPRVTTENPNIPQSIENIIIKACAKNPKNRYDSVAEMYNDMATALSEEHKDDKMYVYPYSEQDLEETKKIEKLGEADMSADKNEFGVSNKDEKNGKFLNTAIVITGMVCLFLAVSVGVLLILYPKFTEVPEVTIPDVSNKSIADAEEILEKLGLVVNDDVTEQPSNDIVADKVIKTKPLAGQTVKKGKMVELIVSIGTNTIVLEDYNGKNYYEIKGQLEAKGLVVFTEKKETTDTSITNESTIIGQSPKAGEKVKEGDNVTLYVPDIVINYPDFVAEKWSVTEVEEFCSEHNVTLSKTIVTTDKYPNGTVFSQSRAAGTKVMANTTLKISIAQTPTIPDPSEDVAE